TRPRARPDRWPSRPPGCGPLSPADRITSGMKPLLLLAALVAAEPDRPFAITVVDAQTGRGVPLVELKTVHGLRLVTDSNGIVAFHEPGLMDQTVFFHVSGHGYEFPKDGFGIRGKR